MGLFRTISDEINQFVAVNFPEGLILFGQIAGKALLLLVFFILADTVLSVFNTIVSRVVVNVSKNKLIKYAYKSKVQNSLAHLFALGLCFLWVEDIFLRHP